MNTDNFRELTQTLIALVITTGTFYILITQPSSPALPIATTALGTVLGFYFARVSNAQGVNSVLRAQSKVQ